MQINDILTKEIPQVEKDIERAKKKTEQVEEEIEEVMKKKGGSDFDYGELEFKNKKLEYLRQDMHYLGRKMHYLRRKEDLLRQEIILLKAQKRSKTLSKFEFKIDEDDDFPLHGGGRVLFKRDHFIKNVANMVLEKNIEGKHSSHYWRAPVGSGKTVFLKLLGRELASSGYDVYMTSGNEMDIYDKYHFRDLAKQAGDKPVVLLIDEVQNNFTSKHWPDLLKENKPANLVVLGVGVFPWQPPSPRFDYNYPEDNELFPMFFTADDREEVINSFARRFPSHAEYAISEVCQRMLTFTSGHAFPFVKFVDHLLNSTHELNLETIDEYLSSKEFSESDVYKQVRGRCFYHIRGTILYIAANQILLQENPSDAGDLEIYGFWNSKDVISPLVASEVFRNHKVYRDSATLDETEEKAPYAQQILSAGLRDMTEEQFKDAGADVVALENAVGFHWAFNVKSCLRNVWITTLARNHKGRGRKPNIDFFINGHVNMRFELVLNGSAAKLVEHLEQVKKNGVVFHIDTKNDTIVNVDWKDERPVYTFLKERNELYRNSCLVQHNVSNALPSPPARS